MIDTLLEPFSYGYMSSAILVSTMVGGLCAFLSAYLMLKGWSLIGDALAHSVVPGVAGAYLLGLPFAIGAFISGGLAASLMLFLSERSGLKADVVIGIIFTAFFGVGLFVVSLYPMSISIETIIMGNILAISYPDMVQLLIIGSISLLILVLKWRDLMVVFFDETHARTVGLNPSSLKIVFFTLLSASIVAALQTVGAFLVIAMVVTPGATAYLICDRFPKLIFLSVLIGSITCFTGAYLSFFIDGATGGIIVVLQTIVFLVVFLTAPKYGYISARLKIRQPYKRIENDL
jgi:manganese/iron transport system permease protein